MCISTTEFCTTQYWVVSHSLVSFYLALMLISFSQFTAIAGRFGLYRVLYYCTISTECSVTGHKWLWIEHLRCFIMCHWVNFCIIWADLTQFSSKMNNCGTSHSQISPMNLVCKCSQASHVWTLGRNGTVLNTEFLLSLQILNCSSLILACLPTPHLTTINIYLSAYCIY